MVTYLPVSLHSHAMHDGVRHAEPTSLEGTANRRRRGWSLPSAGTTVVRYLLVPIGDIHPWYQASA